MCSRNNTKYEHNRNIIVIVHVTSRHCHVQKRWLCGLKVVHDQHRGDEAQYVADDGRVENGLWEVVSDVDVHVATCCLVAVEAQDQRDEDARNHDVTKA